MRKQSDKTKRGPRAQVLRKIVTSLAIILVAAGVVTGVYFLPEKKKDDPVTQALPVVANLMKGALSSFA